MLMLFKCILHLVAGVESLHLVDIKAKRFKWSRPIPKLLLFLMNYNKINWYPNSNLTFQTITKITILYYYCMGIFFFGELLHRNWISAKGTSRITVLLTTFFFMKKSHFNMSLFVRCFCFFFLWIKRVMWILGLVIVKFSV